MDAARLLAEIIAQKAPVSAAQYQSFTAFRFLIESGYVEEVGIVQSVHCDDCDQPHDADVVFELGEYGIYCPDLGFTVKARSELIAIRPNLVRLVENLADCLDCKRSKTIPIDGHTWRVGVVSCTSADVAVYFQPTLQDANDLRSLEAALAREAKARFGVIVTAYGELACPPFKTLHIEDCLSIDETTGRLEFEADLLTVAGAPVTQTGGRPSPYAITLPKLIGERRKTGMALPGTNEEARAIQAFLKSARSNEPLPSLSTIKRAIAKA
ncbi:hypothetical protein ATO10_10945 [Actibacterium atlanticum]|uniref:Uncharacterized protein n=1 Tax=Actibacterium atlanticum TaxID=1461693 RepID=A0A058ZJY0_9RHOB|nr:hypothetical protein [Actibacterium atlanticum]KCV81858.1 hypothetical protein ATO10_10945 [Actibacterium atlanticum]